MLGLAHGLSMLALQDATPLQDDAAVQPVTPKRGILEESKQQPAVSSPHRTRFVPAPIVKAPSGPLPTPLAVDSQLNGSHHQQASAERVGRLGQHGAGNENENVARHLQSQPPLPSRAAPAGTTSASRLGNEEMQQAEALVQATRSSNANAGVAGIIARFEPINGSPAEPLHSLPSQTARPSTLQPQAAGLASEQALSQQHQLSRQASDVGQSHGGQPHAAQSQFAAGPSDASSAAQLQQDMRPAMDQAAQPQEASQLSTQRLLASMRAPAVIRFRQRMTL